jgi:hypothetical protein
MCHFIKSHKFAVANLFKFTDTGISDLSQKSKEFFSSELQGNVGDCSIERPGLILHQKLSRFKPI